MDQIGMVVAWFTDPAHWSGSSGIPNRLFEHIWLSALVVAVGTAIAVPIGLIIGHTGRGALVAITIANLGRALPSYSLLLIFFTFVRDRVRDRVPRPPLAHDPARAHQHLRGRP